jgi:hypothetical protein
LEKLQLFLRLHIKIFLNKKNSLLKIKKMKSNVPTTYRSQLQQKLQTLSNRIESAIKSDRFRTYTKRKQHQLLQRLQRYQNRLNIVLRPSLKAALLGAGLLLSAATVQAQNFVAQTGTDNPFDGVDVGSFSSPTFVDIDNDGDMDAFIAESYANIYYYKNTGSNTAPIFVEQTGTDNPFDGGVGTLSRPTFVDIDNDGDMDAFIGEYFGNIYYYKNTGSNTAPTFVAQIGMDNPFDGINAGSAPSPTFVDIDNDGDMDAFVGEYYGNINYYKNTGSNTAPIFVEQTGTDNPFDGVDVGDVSIPTFVDIDNDGDMDAFIGEYDNIKHYKNTGDNTTPTFVEQTGTDNPFDGVDVGYYSSPTFVDIDNDGDMDAFIGEYYGTIKFYSNGFLTNSEAVLEENIVSIFPNPVVDVLTIEMDNVKGEAVILNLLGQPIKTVRINAEQTTIDVADLSQGQYVLRITTEEGKTITQSFVK